MLGEIRLSVTLDGTSLKLTTEFRGFLQEISRGFLDDFQGNITMKTDF